MRDIDIIGELSVEVYQWNNIAINRKPVSPFCWLVGLF